MTVYNQSPLPWAVRASIGGANGDSVAVVDKNGGVVCLMKNAGGRKLENAIFLVETVNGTSGS
jgi:hypothetical protein